MSSLVARTNHSPSTSHRRLSSPVDVPPCNRPSLRCTPFAPRIFCTRPIDPSTLCCARIQLWSVRLTALSGPPPPSLLLVKPLSTHPRISAWTAVCVDGLPSRGLSVSKCSHMRWQLNRPRVRVCFHLLPSISMKKQGEEGSDRVWRLESGDWKERERMGERRKRERDGVRDRERRRRWRGGRGEAVRRTLQR